MHTAKVPLYCSEQIKIPEKLPEIMKVYCKAAIRTQPFDILKWSTAYFRDLADDLPPVVKTCLEKETRTKYLTKGCLRMFVEKIGKGFFVHRRILKKLWEIILPVDEFYKFLSLGKMLYWRELHWLKLIGIMAGYLSKDLRGTMTLICELLTNDLEGGTASIPIWMFITIYKFLAELDCANEQRILNGRRELGDGTFEELLDPNELPYIMSSFSLNKCLAESCIEENPSKCISSESFKEYDIYYERESPEKKDDSKWLENVKVYGSISEPERIFKRCHDFDTLIFYIKTHEIKKPLELNEGPYHINQKMIMAAREKEKKYAALREKFDIFYKENVCYVNAFEDKVAVLKEIGPPWSWIFDFMACSGQDKSYNYIDDQSIISDKTPDTSSDESFDFVTEKPIAYCSDLYRNDVLSIKSVSSYQSSCDEKNISELLLNRQRNTNLGEKTKSSLQMVESEKSIEKIIKGKTRKKNPLEFDVVVSEFGNIIQEKDGASTDEDSITVVKPDVSSILRLAGERTGENFEYGFIFEILKVSLDENRTFANLEEVLDYIRCEYDKWYNKHQLSDITEEENDECDEVSTSPEWVDKEEISEVTDEPSLTAFNFGAGDYQGSRADERECKEEDRPIKEKTPPPPPPPPEKQIQKNIEETFGDDITIDAKTKSKKVDKTILGLVSGSDASLKDVMESETSSELSEDPFCVDKTGYYSDDSSIFPPPPIEKDNNVKYKEYKETCQLPREYEKIYDYNIPKLPGIGGKVCEKILCKFLEYINFCALKQQGMITKSNLYENDCPPLQDLTEYKNIETEMQQETIDCIRERLTQKCPSAIDEN